jgi:hypothetical protein
MSTLDLVLPGAFELISLIVIARMWQRRWHRRWVVRLLWSIVLLVPILGLPGNFFIRPSPDEHPYDTDTMRSGAEASGE